MKQGDVSRASRFAGARGRTFCFQVDTEQSRRLLAFYFLLSFVSLTVVTRGKRSNRNKINKGEVEMMSWLYSKAMEAIKKDAEREKADYQAGKKKTSKTK